MLEDSVETPKVIEPGCIKLLWSTGHYDGMQVGVGELNGTPVYLTTSAKLGCRGDYFKIPKVQQFCDLMYELFDDADQEIIENIIDNNYWNRFYEYKERIFEVFELTTEEYKILHDAHKQWELHAGLYCTFEYKDGVPFRPYHWHQWVNDIFKVKSNESYITQHLYENNKIYNKQRDLTLEYCSIYNQRKSVGIITSKNLYKKSNFPDLVLSDPRSDELKKYQKKWKFGDPVRLDW